MYPRSMADSDCVVVQGSNMAECHPVAFRWPMQAKLKGAKLIHVDPRFTRTSAMADIHAPIRSGSDVAFLGGLINYVLQSERWNTAPFFKEFVVNYTNAPTIIGATSRIRRISTGSSRASCSTSPASRSGRSTVRWPVQSADVAVRGGPAAKPRAAGPPSTRWCARCSQPLRRATRRCSTRGRLHRAAALRPTPRDGQRG